MLGLVKDVNRTGILTDNAEGREVAQKIEEMYTDYFSSTEEYKRDGQEQNHTASQ